MKRFELLRSLGPDVWCGFFALTPRAYWGRLRTGRSPFAPTFPDRHRHLPKASLDGRGLSREEYLRPTWRCDCHAPEIVAVADDLRRGAATDWDYAQAVFDFTAKEITHALEGPPRGVVDTLRRGYGLCFEKVLLFIALARAGGLPARYCRLRVELTADDDLAPWAQIPARLAEILETKSDPRLREVAAAWRGLIRLVQGTIQARVAQSMSEGRPFTLERTEGPHPIAEVNVGGVWIPVDPSPGDAEAAFYGLPLERFGYLPMLLRLVRGSISARIESPTRNLRVHALRLLFCVLARGALDCINLSVEESCQRGNKILEEVGRAEYIRKHRRFYVPVEGVSTLGITLPPYPTG